MGYSARYHVASLAAVFLALAIGILIGAEFGDDIVSDTRQNLRSSLTENLRDEQDRADDLAADLQLSEDFAERVYPTLVAGRLTGRRIGLIALGDVSDDLATEIETALEPTGAGLAAVAVVREPPDLDFALASDLAATRFAEVDTDLDLVQALGTGFGRQAVLGGTLLEATEGKLLGRASGTLGELDGVIVVREQPDTLEGEDRVATLRLESGLLDGLSGTGAATIGVETTGSDPSSISFFQGQELASIDNLNTVAGRVSVVFSLLGARGSFGVKDTADRLLPDLLPVPSPTGGGARGPGGNGVRENTPLGPARRSRP